MFLCSCKSFVFLWLCGSKADIIGSHFKRCLRRSLSPQSNISYLENIPHLQTAVDGDEALSGCFMHTENILSCFQCKQGQTWRFYELTFRAIWKLVLHRIIWSKVRSVHLWLRGNGGAKFRVPKPFVLLKISKHFTNNHRSQRKRRKYK